jgi:hypothetical protein
LIVRYHIIFYYLKLKMVERKAKKRKVTVEDTAASVDLEEGWVTKLLELPGDELARLLGDIANHGKIKTAAIKKARTSAKWTVFAEKFGLPDKLENNRFERVVTPVYNPFMSSCSRQHGVHRMSISRGRSKGEKRQGSESWIRYVSD